MVGQVSFGRSGLGVCLVVSSWGSRFRQALGIGAVGVKDVRSAGGSVGVARVWG